MKFVKFVCLLLVVACSYCTAKDPELQFPEEKEEKGESGKETELDRGKYPPMEEIVSFFSESLLDKHAFYEKQKNFDISEIEHYRSMIWKVWKEANARFDEEKLIELMPLSVARTGKWHLPTSLEPDAVMPYYWGTKGEKPEKGYPLYLYMHGSGGKESEWATGLNICQRFADAPSVYFIPQIPNEGAYYRWWQKAKQYAWEKLLRQAFLSGEVDPDRVYFFGISEGGYGSQRLASFYADYLAGAGPMAGGEPLKNAPAENCRNMAFSLRTGDNDRMFYRNTLTSYVKEEFERLQRQNPETYIHRVELIPGAGHSIDYTPTTPWLSRYTRNPYPKQVSWEDFEMDGLHRRGFYNLYVKERPDENARTFYEMNISGNDIELKVSDVVYETVERDPRWGIEMKFRKNYTPVKKGKLILYLCPELVDLSRKVTVSVNGRKVYTGKVRPELKHIVNSCAAFCDPRRLYPAAVEVTLSE